MTSWLRLGGGSLAGLAIVISACGGSNESSGFGGGGSSSSSGGGSGSSGSSGGYVSDSGMVGRFGDAASGSSSGAVGDAGCEGVSAKAHKSPVYMEFVQDGSGSMAQNNKWKAVVPALEAIFKTIEMANDDGEGVGLTVFSDTKDPTSGFGPYPDAKDIPLAFVSSTQLTSLDGRLSGGPGGGTPTGKALQGAYSYLETFAPTSPLLPGGEKVVVILTDGVPEGDVCDIKAGQYATNPCVTMAAAELAKGIKTFVIGTGPFPSSSLQNYDPSFLGYLAQAGGTAPKGCNPADNTSTASLCYFSVDPTKGNAAQTEAAFEAAINSIRGQVLSCTFPLTSTSDAGTVDPSKVNVTINGMTIPEGGANGWSYDDPKNPTSITFTGTSCNTIKTDPSADVQIVLGCKTIVSGAN